LRRTVDAGLGQWLAGGVEVDRRLAQGRFQGWIVRSLYPGDPCYRDVDVKVGDVVVRVNGKSVERPEQASDVFSSLRSAPALVVELLRGGEARTVTLPISEE
jgi:type II secretory pathway component PulC